MLVTPACSGLGGPGGVNSFVVLDVLGGGGGAGAAPIRRRCSASEPADPSRLRAMVRSCRLSHSSRMLSHSVL